MWESLMRGSLIIAAVRAYFIVKGSFQRMMTEIYEQEHNSMISIIGDARRSLAMTVDELHDEQQVLSLTADKIG